MIFPISVSHNLFGFPFLPFLALPFARPFFTTTFPIAPSSFSPDRFAALPLAFCPFSPFAGALVPAFAGALVAAPAGALVAAPAGALVPAPPVTAGTAVSAGARPIRSFQQLGVSRDQKENETGTHCS